MAWNKTVTISGARSEARAIKLGLGLGSYLDDCGPWRPVVLEQYTARIDDVWIQYEIPVDNTNCSGTLHARVGAGAQEGDTVLLSLFNGDEAVFEQKCHIGVDGLAKAAVQLVSPSLWYPHGYGSQFRYRLSACLSRGDTRLDEQSKLIGFRRCQLVQEKDEFGKSFYFRINGVDIFAGGSCWIPADSYHAQVSKDCYLEWMKLMVESNQIMIHVWGRWNI